MISRRERSVDYCVVDELMIWQNASLLPGWLSVLASFIAIRQSRVDRIEKLVSRVQAETGLEAKEIATRIASDEELLEAVIRGVEAAERSTDETHRRMIAGVIAAGVTERLWINETALLMATLAGLQGVHVDVLLVLDQPHTAPVDIASYTSKPEDCWDLATLAATWKGADPDVVRAVLAQLARDGLAEKPDLRPGNEGGVVHLPVLSDDLWRITAYGRRLLAYASDSARTITTDPP
jgi:hypothetical protein